MGDEPGLVVVGLDEFDGEDRIEEGEFALDGEVAAPDGRELDLVVAEIDLGATAGGEGGGGTDGVRGVERVGNARPNAVRLSAWKAPGLAKSKRP